MLFSISLAGSHFPSTNSWIRPVSATEVTVLGVHPALPKISVALQVTSGTDLLHPSIRDVTTDHLWMIREDLQRQTCVDPRCPITAIPACGTDHLGTCNHRVAFNRTEIKITNPLQVNMVVHHR